MPILGIDASRAVKKEKTGVEWYSYFLLRAMEKCTPEGWAVRCYVPSLEYAEVRPPIRRRTDLDWEWRKLKWIGRGWTQGRLSLEMMKSPPDVLFVPSHVVPLVHPVNTVTTVHDVVFLSHPELYDPKDLESQKRGLDFALKFAKRIIVPSRAVREDMIKAGATGEQVVVVPHGVGIEDVEAEPTGRRRLGLTVWDSYILFIGRLERKKNVLGLIHALRFFQEDVKLVLAGPLGFGGEDVLQAIKTFRLQDRVIHLGYVERAKYHGLLKSAAMLVFPSFGEGFGLPVLEAIAVGTPVVCSDLPALREVGGNAVQYINPNDPEDMVRGIETVLENEMLRSEMARAGKERTKEFTWDRSAKETWNAVCNTIGL